MSNVNELIGALSNGDMVKANSVFGDLMGSKINDALDDAKIQMAQSMLGVEEDQEKVEYEEETEDEDEL
jgi:hypothetical protein